MNISITSKRGISVWVSWVLIMGFAVALGVFFFAWIKGFAIGSSGEIAERSDRITLCDSVSIRIDKLCQDTQTLNMNVTNSNSLKTDELIFRFYSIYEEPELRSTNFTLRPSETKNLMLVKQGIVKQAEAIPVIYKDRKRIICENKRVTVTGIPIC